MTPNNTPLPPEDFGTDMAAGPINLYLGSEPQPSSTTEPTIPPLTPDNLGNLETSPALNEYQYFAQNNPPIRLFLLSATLISQNHPSRAVLALERIIDSSPSTPIQKIQAASQIIALQKDLPPWNLDPANTCHPQPRSQQSSNRHPQKSTSPTYLSHRPSFWQPTRYRPQDHPKPTRSAIPTHPFPLSHSTKLNKHSKYRFPTPRG